MSSTFEVTLLVLSTQDKSRILVVLSPGMTDSDISKQELQTFANFSLLVILLNITFSPNDVYNSSPLNTGIPSITVTANSII